MIFHTITWVINGYTIHYKKKLYILAQCCDSLIPLFNFAGPSQSLGHFQNMIFGEDLQSIIQPTKSALSPTILRQSTKRVNHHACLRWRLWEPDLYRRIAFLNVLWRTLRNVWRKPNGEYTVRKNGTLFYMFFKVTVSLFLLHWFCCELFFYVNKK